MNDEGLKASCGKQQVKTSIPSTGIFTLLRQNSQQSPILISSLKFQVSLIANV